MKKFKEFINKGFNGMKYKVLEEFSLPADFQVNRNFNQGNYLKVVVVQKLS